MWEKGEDDAQRIQHEQIRRRKSFVSLEKCNVYGFRGTVFAALPPLDIQYVLYIIDTTLFRGVNEGLISR